MSTSDPGRKAAQHDADPQQPRSDRVEACTASVRTSATLAAVTAIAVLGLVLVLALLL